MILSSSPQQNSRLPKPHTDGHRDRLRARMHEHGAGALHDYELLELLLFTAIPRKDVKALAKALLSRFRTLWAVMNASPDQLLAIKVTGADGATCLTRTAAHSLSAIGAIALRAQRNLLIKGPLLSNWQGILDYCRAALSHETKEQFRLLFFDRKNHLLTEEIHQHGTIDHAPVYPREVVQRALEVGAGALVLVHNHPSGDPRPSKADIEMTRKIVEACSPLGITIHDHIIIGAGEPVSFKALGLL